MLNGHEISEEYVRSSCGSPGHSDLVLTCTCGWTKTVSHGRRSDGEKTRLYHRIQALEDALNGLLDA